jgi:TPP-dependent pyruvate/acetoin dehydrogenase alpha subunit
MRGTGSLHDADVAEIEAAVGAEVDAAVAFAEAGSWEPAEDLAKDVYAGEPA